MLYLFDLDGTIVQSYMERPNKEYHDCPLLPNRKEKMAQLLADGHQIAWITNQAGVAFFKVKVWETKKKFKAVKRALEISTDTPVYVCYHHPNGRGPWRDPDEVKRRKPSGEMIREAMRDFKVEPEDVLYVGDMEVDEQAAADAGVKFQWAWDFFGTPDPR